MLIDVPDHFGHVDYPGPFLEALAQQLLALLGPLDDVDRDGCRLGELEVAVDEVGQVGEFQAETLPVLAEPLLRLLVPDVLKVCAGVSQQKSGDLC